MTDGAGLWRRSDSTCGQDAQDGSHRFDRCQHRGMADRKTDAFCTVQQRTQLRLDGKGKVPISAAEAVGQALSELFGNLPLRRIADLLNGCRGGGIQPECLLHIADLRTANQGIHLRAQGGSQQDTNRCSRTDGCGCPDRSAAAPVKARWERLSSKNEADCFAEPAAVLPVPWTATVGRPVLAQRSRAHSGWFLRLGCDAKGRASTDLLYRLEQRIRLATA